MAPAFGPRSLAGYITRSIALAPFTVSGPQRVLTPRAGAPHGYGNRPTAVQCQVFITSPRSQA